MEKIGRWLTILSPAIVVGILIGAYPGYKAYEYMWKDARFCMTCHQHDYASLSWKNSIHGRVTTCHDCHHQPLHQYAEEIVVLLTQKEIYPKSMKHIPYVTKNLCESCHIDHPHDTSSISGPFAGKNLKDIPKINKTRLHALHLSKETDAPLPRLFNLLKDDTTQFGKFRSETHPNARSSKKRHLACVDCHGGIPNRAHNFSATDASCINCHEKIAKHPTKLQKTFGCRNCHFTEFFIE
ncbi:MAG: NapC/NirT family cytochrome c [Deltaproteobacteria bacterium]|nr:NapC/NirT family cytochrome c [Deltaproteobacteria bacterium]